MVAMEEFLTVPEVAARLRVSTETVRRWLRAGKLKGVQIGGTRVGYRVRDSDVEKMIAEAEAKPASSQRETSPL